MRVWTDHHCHLHDPAFSEDLEDVVAASRALGVKRWRVCGTHPDDWDTVRTHCADLVGAEPAYGLHPWFINEETSSIYLSRLERILRAEPAAWLGEAGLDGLRETPLDRQCAFLAEQWRLAETLGRPIILHCVHAWAEMRELAHAHPSVPAVLHGFQGNTEIVRQFRDLPVWFSVGGAVLRQKPGKKMLKGLLEIPDDRLLLETDSPFMHPQGRQHRQVPANLVAIAEQVASLRGVSVDELARTVRHASAALRAFSTGFD